MTDRDAAVDAVIHVAKNFDSCFDGKVADDCPESTYLCSHWEAAVRAAVEQAIVSELKAIPSLWLTHYGKHELKQRIAELERQRGAQG